MNALYQDAVAVAKAQQRNLELLLFRLGGDAQGQRNELFGVDVFHMREIAAMPAVTAIAGAPPMVLGVVHLRGEIIEVIDLPALAGCRPARGLNIMLVIEWDGGTHALAVEAVEEIVLLDECQLAPAAFGSANGVVSSIARLDDGPDHSRLAQVLNLGAILQHLHLS